MNNRYHAHFFFFFISGKEEERVVTSNLHTHTYVILVCMRVCARVCACRLSTLHHVTYVIDSPTAYLPTYLDAILCHAERQSVCVCVGVAISALASSTHTFTHTHTHTPLYRFMHTKCFKVSRGGKKARKERVSRRPFYPRVAVAADGRAYRYVEKQHVIHGLGVLDLRVSSC